MEPIKVVLADSNILIREGLKNVFDGEGSFKVIGEIMNGAVLVSEVLRLKPDVVVIDYLSTSFRTEDIKQLKAEIPECKFVALTEFAERNLVRRAMQAGISGHILKSCDRDEILDSVRSTNSGECFYCGKILEVLRDPEMEGTEVSCDPIKLSHREIDIIREIADGKTNKQIAEACCISTHTVMTHRKNIMQKLGIRNTAGMVIYAVRENLISPSKYLAAGA